MSQNHNSVLAPLTLITSACHGGDRLEALLSYGSSVFLGRGFLVNSLGVQGQGSLLIH